MTGNAAQSTLAEVGIAWLVFARVCLLSWGGLMSAALGWASVSELVTEIQTGLVWVRGPPVPHDSG